MRNVLTRDRLLAGMLFMFALAIYANALTFDFLSSWDDNFYLLENDLIPHLSWPNLKETFTNFFVGNYAPVHIISYMVEYAFWGFAPSGYHAANLVLHGGNGVLAYFLFRRLRLPPGAALVAAVLFLCHPVQVESVAWISESKNLLALGFLLVAFHGYCAYRDAPSRRWRWYAVALAAALLALLCKSIAVIFPAVLVLYDLCFPRRGEPRRGIAVADKLPFVLAAAVVVVMTLVGQSEQAGGGRRDFPGGSPLSTLYTMLPVLGSYLRDCLVPGDLLPYYLVKIRTHVDGTVIAMVLVALGLILFGWFLWRRNRHAFFYYAFFFLALLPVSQVVPLVTLKQDRYLYVPLLGFAGLVAEGGNFLWQRFPRGRKVVAGTALLLILAHSALTLKQVRIWRDDLTLWNHTVSVDPENMMGWVLLAKLHTMRGDKPEALAALRTFTQLKLKYGPIRGYPSY